MFYCYIWPWPQSLTSSVAMKPDYIPRVLMCLGIVSFLIHYRITLFGEQTYFGSKSIVRCTLKGNQGWGNSITLELFAVHTRLTFWTLPIKEKKYKTGYMTKLSSNFMPGLVSNIHEILVTNENSILLTQMILSQLFIFSNNAHIPEVNFMYIPLPSSA